MQVAIVTGASSGIGFGCATKLAETGMAVLGTGRDEERLADLEKAVGDPDRVATVAVDLTADDAPQRIVDLPRCSGGAASTSWSTMPASAVPSRCTRPTTSPWTISSDLMLRAPFRLARDVIPHMQPGRRSST